jgi:hypothetical protein
MSAPRRRAFSPEQGHITEVPFEPEPSDPGDGGNDGGNDLDIESLPQSEADDPGPNPNLNAEANGEEQVGR